MIRSLRSLLKDLTKSLFSHVSISEDSLRLGITLWSCMIERSPDLTFIWDFVRYFSSDLKDLILIRLGHMVSNFTFDSFCSFQPIIINLSTVWTKCWMLMQKKINRYYCKFFIQLLLTIYMSFIWTNLNSFDLRKHYAKYFHAYFDFYILMELDIMRCNMLELTKGTLLIKLAVWLFCHWPWPYLNNI